MSDELKQLNLDDETETLAALEEGFDGWVEVFGPPTADDDEEEPAA